MSKTSEVIVGPVQVRFLLTGEETNGSVAVFELFVPASGRLPAPTHLHRHYEESIYGLEGVLTFSVDDVATEIGPGEALCVPRGAVHRFDNFGSVDTKVLCMVSPAEIGPEYFREVGAVLAAAGDGPPDRVKMMEIMKRHGLEPVA